MTYFSVFSAIIGVYLTFTSNSVTHSPGVTALKVSLIISGISTDSPNDLKLESP